MGEQRADRTGDARLIGRDIHLAALRSSLEAACAGAGQVLFLAGDAGVGKTSLMEEFATKVTVRGVQVLASAAFAPESAVPYALFVNVLRPLLRLPISATTAGSRHALLEELLASERRAVRGKRSGSDGGKTHLFESIYTLLSRVSADVPLVIQIGRAHV